MDAATLSPGRRTVDGVRSGCATASSSPCAGRALAQGMDGVSPAACCCPAAYSCFFN